MTDRKLAPQGPCNPVNSGAAVKALTYLDSEIEQTLNGLSVSEIRCLLKSAKTMGSRKLTLDRALAVEHRPPAHCGTFEDWIEAVDEDYYLWDTLLLLHQGNSSAANAHARQIYNDNL